MTQWVTELAAWSITAFAALLFGAQLVARELGTWIGQRYAARHDGAAEGTGILVGAMLGLLGFVLALTLSFANARYEERRAGTLAEANAIGTAWLRAEAVGHPRGAEIARLLEGYTVLRADYVRAPRDRSLIAGLNERTGAVQAEIWGHLSALVRERTDPVVVSLMTALNEVFDMATAERFAHAQRLPDQLFWLLVGMALLGMAAVGFQLGLRGRPLRVLSMLLTAMWTVVILDILDLAAPRLGTFRTSATVYEWTLQGFQGNPRIPPVPRP